MPFERVLSLDQLKPSQPVKVTAGGQPVLLALVDGAVHAVHDTCLHRGGSLSAGELEGEVVVCPLHFWGFSVKSGLCTQVPSLGLKVFGVKVEQGEIYVEV